METYFDAHILIVDDNPTNVLLLKALLESSGYYNLASTTDPRTVLQHITENTTDLLILDIRMPFLNGFDVMALLSKQLGDASPPVVVMTAQIDEETRKKAFEYGALNFLTKPFDHDEVLKRINNILAIQYRNKKSTSQAQELQQLVDSRTEELQALSLQEPLTGLPNRRALKQEMQNNIAKGKFITVMFIVIDNVNVMANVHGYQVLEKLLCHISQLLKDCFNDSQHYLSSWGSYEFVLMSTCNDPGSAFISAEKITDILQDIHTIDNLRLQLNGRVGLCDSRTEYKDVLDLIDFAAIALPNFKEQRRYRFYETKLRDVLRYKQNILTEIRSARFGAGLSLVYQAKVDLASGQVKSAEALLRFNSRLGQLSPADFIPLAEESGDILF
ncbi:MAG TPA: response regulator, partial [Methylophaga sp.]|nr:response regulator [Methylophaga sp.]